MATGASESEMVDNAIRLEGNLRKFINHVDNLIEEEDPAGNGFHKEYRVG